LLSAGNTSTLATVAAVQTPIASVFYPGQLWSDDGLPVSDGLYDFEFSLHDVLVGGTPLWSEVESGITVTNGSFVVELGRMKAFPPDVLAHRALWLAIAVRGPGDSNYTQLSPRRPYALDEVVEVAGITAGPSCAHNHVGEVWNGAVAWSSGVLKVNNTLNGPTLWGVNSGGGNGVRGDGYGTSLGVYGEADDAPGVVGRSAQQYGVEGYGKHGVKGEANGSGTGVYGKSVDGGGVYGHSDNQIGVFGEGALFGIYSNGDAKIDGDLVVTGSKSGYVVDIAQNDGADPLETGDVVVITGVGPAILGEIPVVKVRKADEAATTAVVGVVDQAYQPDASTHGETVAIAQQEYLQMVTLGAYRGIKVDATYGAVSPGDLLVTSPNPGYAMRAESPRPGTIVGKALGELSSGTGVIPVFVTLQ
jgi:hypothetical protein